MDNRTWHHCSRQADWRWTTGRSISTRSSAGPTFQAWKSNAREAWGLVARLPGTGTGDGSTLMLNGHIDVVPQGDPDSWEDDPFSGSIRDGNLLGRGACDMKAGLVAAALGCASDPSSRRRTARRCPARLGAG